MLAEFQKAGQQEQVFVFGKEGVLSDPKAKRSSFFRSYLICCALKLLHLKVDVPRNLWFCS